MNDLIQILWPYAALLALVTAQPAPETTEQAARRRADLEQAGAQLAEARRLAAHIHERTHRP